MESVLTIPEGRDRLLGKALELESVVQASGSGPAGRRESVQARVERRDRWFRAVEDAVLDLTNSLPAGTEDYEARQLFRFMTDMRRSIESDGDALDSEGKVALDARRMIDVIRRIERRLQHSVLEDPVSAVGYVFEQLDSLTAAELAEILGVTPKTIGAWRAGSPVKAKADRAKLVAQLVCHLEASMSQLGLLMWFRHGLRATGGRSPIELMNDDLPAAAQQLIPLARGGRGQLAG